MEKCTLEKRQLIYYRKFDKNSKKISISICAIILFAIFAKSQRKTFLVINIKSNYYGKKSQYKRWWS
jgi:hypothetical protein